MSDPAHRHERQAVGVAAGETASAQEDEERGRPPRPNILWLVSEDNNPTYVGAYGEPLARTPMFDRLAREGILYRNVYSTAPVCAPSRFSIITGVSPESCAPANHMRAVATLPPALRAFTEYLREVGYYCTNNAKTDYNCDIEPMSVWDESSRTAHWRNRPAGAPFFAVFNNETCHESVLFGTLDGAVKPEDVRVPGYLPDTPDIRRDIATYYNAVAQMDAELVERLAELEADGLLEDTIVFYYSDNGGSLPRSKRYCYDEGLRCALVVRVPARWAHLAPTGPGSEVATPVTFLDLAPTVLSLSGIARPEQMQGSAFLGRDMDEPAHYAFGMRNRMDERYDFVRTVTDGRFRYIRNYMPHRPWGQHQAYAWLAKGYQDWERQFRAGRLDADQAQFFQEKLFEQFFDLRDDPDQLRNLIDHPAHKELVDAMRDALTRHMLDINDNGFIPEGSTLEGYEASRAPDAYPLEAIIALAESAAHRDPSAIDLLRRHLEHTNEVMRYWAAQGLLMQGEASAPARSQLQAMMHGEPSPQVRIVAAEALTYLGDPAEPVSVLASFVESRQRMPVRLQALNALTFLGEASRPALPAITRAAEDEQPYIRSAGRYLKAILDGSYDPATPMIDLRRPSRSRPAVT